MVLSKKILAISLLMVLICMCSVTFISAANAENVAADVECIEAIPYATSVDEGSYLSEANEFNQEAALIGFPVIINKVNDQLSYKSELVVADEFAINKNSISSNIAYGNFYKSNDIGNDLYTSTSLNVLTGVKERADIGFGILSKFSKSSALLAKKTVSTDFNKVQALSTNVDFKVSTSTIAQGYNAMGVIGNTFVDSIANVKIKFSNPVIATEDIVAIPATEAAAPAAVAEAVEATATVDAAAEKVAGATVDGAAAGALGAATKVAPAADYTNAAAKKVADYNTEAMADALKKRCSATTSIAA